MTMVTHNNNISRACIQHCSIYYYVCVCVTYTKVQVGIIGIEYNYMVYVHGILKYVCIYDIRADI